MNSSRLLNVSSVLFTNHAHIDFPVPGFDGIRHGAAGRQTYDSLGASEAIVVLVGNGFSEWKSDGDERVCRDRYNSALTKPKLRDGSYAKAGSNGFGALSAGRHFNQIHMTLLKNNGRSKSKRYELTSAGWELFDEVYKRLGIENPRYSAPKTKPIFKSCSRVIQLMCTRGDSVCSN